MRTSIVSLQVVCAVVCALAVLACEKDSSSAPAANPASTSVPVSAPASTAAASAATPVPPAPATSPPMPGSDRDAHGCIGSAGYRWCAQESACVRPWELAKAKGFADGPSAFAAYCH